MYVAGRSYGSGTSYDFATIKYNSNGVEQWVARYNGPGNGNDMAFAIATDNTGNIYVSGGSYSSGTDYDYATVKYNSSGDTVWVRRYNGPGNSADEAYAIAVDSAGNVYVTGYSRNTSSHGSEDYATIKYNSSGIEQWVTRYNGSGDGEDRALSLTLDGQTNVYVTGYSIGSGTNYDYATIKYNSAGGTVWAKRYNGLGNNDDEAYAVALDGQANVYVTGYSIGSGTDYDYATIKYNSAGDTVWVRRYNGPGNSDDEASALALDGQANIYVAGYSTDSGTDDYAIVKYNSSGVQQWVVRYNGPGNSDNWANAIAVDGAGNIYVTGRSVGSGTDFDYATIKYVQTIQGLEEKCSSISASGIQLKVYPNLAKSLSNIRYSLPKDSRISLQLYDISGRLVKTFVNEQKKQGNYSATLNSKTLSAGIYFLSLATEKQRIIERLVVIK